MSNQQDKGVMNKMSMNQTIQNINLTHDFESNFTKDITDSFRHTHAQQ